MINIRRDARDLLEDPVDGARKGWNPRLLPEIRIRRGWSARFTRRGAGLSRGNRLSRVRNFALMLASVIRVRVTRRSLKLTSNIRPKLFSRGVYRTLSQFHPAIISIRRFRFSHSEYFSTPLSRFTGVNCAHFFSRDVSLVAKWANVEGKKMEIHGG